MTRPYSESATCASVAPHPTPDDKIVYVQWLDSCMCHEQVDSDRLPTPSVIHTVGWLADESDEHLTVVREQNPHPDSYRWRSSVSIPRFAVVSIQYLAVPAQTPRRLPCPMHNCKIHDAEGRLIQGDPLLVDHLEGNKRWRDRYRRAVARGT